MITTPDLYRQAGRLHTSKDKEVDWKELRKTENKVDRNVRQLAKALGLGANHDQVDRCKQAMSTQDRPPPSVKLFFKDYKKLKDDDKIPPKRMVCGATEGPLHRASILLDKLI